MILIVEDDILIAEHLSAILLKEGFNNCLIAHSYDDALMAIGSSEIQLVLLDINLGQVKNGFDLSAVLNKNSIPFIYISAQSDPMAQEQIIESKPAGFILKPFKPVQVTTAVKLLFKQIESITLRLDDGKNKYILDIRNVIFIQSNRNYVEINYENQRLVVRKTLIEIEQLLPVNQFFRCHRSFIVNKDRIQSISQKELVIQDKNIPISQKYRSNFYKM
jgi:DNA-binding LytR/AlgR family response regulator